MISDKISNFDEVGPERDILDGIDAGTPFSRDARIDVTSWSDARPSQPAAFA